jgi:hypothetical protein
MKGFGLALGSCNNLMSLRAYNISLSVSEIAMLPELRELSVGTITGDLACLSHLRHLTKLEYGGQWHNREKEFGIHCLPIQVLDRQISKLRFLRSVSLNGFMVNINFRGMSHRLDIMRCLTCSSIHLLFDAHTLPCKVYAYSNARMFIDYSGKNTREFPLHAGCMYDFFENIREDLTVVVGPIIDTEVSL